MKKIAIAISVAALVGISSSCFAGFGIPKVSLPKTVKPAVVNNKADNSKLTKTSQSVDLNGMLANQKEMTQYMINCNNLAVDAWVELKNSTGEDVTGLLAAKKALKTDMSSEDGDLCVSAQADAAKAEPDPAKVKANKEAVKAAIAKAKTLKVTAENERTKAAVMLPAATADIATAAKNALTDFDFAKQFSPVKKAFNMNKKLISASDKNLKSINAHVAKLEKLIAD